MWLVFGHGSIVLQHLLSGLRFLRPFVAEQPVETCENGSHENARQRGQHRRRLRSEDSQLIQFAISPVAF